MIKIKIKVDRDSFYASSYFYPLIFLPYLFQKTCDVYEYLTHFFLNFSLFVENYLSNFEMGSMEIKSCFKFPLPKKLYRNA